MNDAYLQIDGIKGESTDDKHKDWIEVSKVQYSIYQPRAEVVSTGGGHTTGRADLLPITFKKLADISSPMLLQTCATGKTIPKAIFEFLRADGNGNPVPYFRIELENLLIASVTLIAGMAESSPNGSSWHSPKSNGSMYGRAYVEARRATLLAAGIAAPTESAKGRRYVRPLPWRNNEPVPHKTVRF